MVFELRHFLATRGGAIRSVRKAETFLAGYMMACRGCFVCAHQQTVGEGPVDIQQMGS